MRLAIITITISVVLFILIYKILKYLFAIEDNTVLKRYQTTQTKKKKKRKTSYLFQDYIFLPEYKEEEYQRMLYCLDIPMTPEQYVSSYWYAPLPYLACAAIVFIFFKQYIVAVVFLFIALMKFTKEKNKIYRAMDYRKIQIEEEAPNMIRYFITSIENKTDIKTIFEQYSEIAKYLKRDIDLAIIDMNTTKFDKDVMINALYNLDERLNVQIMRDFLTGLIEVLKGKDQHNYFSLLERELKLLTIRNLDRKTKKVQNIARRHLFVLIFNYIFIQVAMIVIFIMDFIKQM